MKIVVFALLIVAATVNAAPKDYFKEDKIVNECLAENGVKEDELDELMMKDDPKVHCLIACIYEKEGMLTNGKLNEDALKKSILKDIPKAKEEIVTNAIDLCKEKVKDVTDICESTTTLTVCLRKQLDEFVSDE